MKDILDCTKSGLYNSRPFGEAKLSAMCVKKTVALKWVITNGQNPEH